MHVLNPTLQIGFFGGVYAQKGGARKVLSATRVKCKFFVGKGNNTGDEPIVIGIMKLAQAALSATYRSEGFIDAPAKATYNSRT
jgi:hypothetical protein